MHASPTGDRRMPVPWRVYAAFFVYALSMGSFYPRLADLQRLLGLSEGVLGMALSGVAVGTIVALTWGTAAVARVGHRRVLLLLLPLIAGLYALASWAPNAWVLFALLVPTGMCIGAVEQVVNLEADRVEHGLGRRIMNRAHAFWSLGFGAAGLISAGVSWLGLGIHAHLALMSGVSLLGTVVLLGGMQPAAQRPGVALGDDHRGGVVTSGPTRTIGWLVLACLGAMLLEGAAIDWSAIYMREVFQGGTVVGGLAVASAAACQAVVRLMADPFVERHGPVRVARSLLLLLALGAVSVVLAPNVATALMGFALIGAGTSVLFPLAMSAAAQLPDRPAAINVAALAQTTFVVYLLAPPLLGWVAQAWGLRATFAVALPVVAAGYAAASALAVRSKAAPAERAPLI
jgi:MFS family permease